MSHLPSRYGIWLYHESAPTTIVLWLVHYFGCEISFLMLLLLSHFSRVWLCSPADCSQPGSSIHGNSPGKNTGVGCHALLQGIFLTQGSNSQSAATIRWVGELTSWPVPALLCHPPRFWAISFPCLQLNWAKVKPSHFLHDRKPGWIQRACLFLKTKCPIHLEAQHNE